MAHRLSSPNRRGCAALVCIAFGLATIPTLLSGCGGSNGAAEKNTGAVAVVRAESDPLPNIIFIMIDTLRADRLHSYGYSRQLTATMDKIAAEGVAFDRCIAVAPWTLPSIASIITGYNPCVHKAASFRQISAMDAGRTAVVPVLDDSFVTLAEELQQLGYQTAGFCANKFIKPEYGMAQGFDVFDTGFAANTVQGKHINEAALKWITESRDASRPMFLYLHYMDVHGPYDAAPRFLDPLLAEVEANPNKQPMPEELFQRINLYLRKPPANASDPQRWNRLSRFRDYWVARYDAGVWEMDYYLSQLVGKLEELGVWDDALVVLTSDHGEALGEHGLWDHGYSQFQTDIHVPLVLRWKNHLPAGQRVKATASQLGLGPTLLELLGVQPSMEVQGLSLLGHIRGDGDIETTAVVSADKISGKQFAVVRDNYKLMLIPRPPQKQPDGSLSPPQVSSWLFDLDADPIEAFDLASTYPEKVRELADVVKAHIYECRVVKPELKPQTRTIGEQEIQKLEALGYTGQADGGDKPPEQSP
ncbi:MAG: hypothetical protein D6744_07270 [Planctomycetota bacterium]|nr:MAG: hypothetical protein D6744_07270 [Planctomycetota bacterium]